MQRHDTLMRCRLTEKEERIVRLVTAGMKNSDIASAIGHSENMTKNFVRRIYDKVGASNRVTLALWWIKNREKQEGGSYEI